MGKVWRFRLQGKPVPYVRMTRRGKYVKRDAQRYLSSKEAMGWQFRAQMARAGRYPIKRGVPIAVSIEFRYGSGADHRRDLDNEIKAVADAANGIVWDDDRWIDQIEAERRESEDDEDWVLVDVAVLE